MLSCTGCGQTERGAAQDTPVVIEVWHYYNGEQQSMFDTLLEEFNKTVGEEKGIVVKGSAQGSVADLERKILASINGEVGAGDIPNIFAAYSSTAYTADLQGLVVDLSGFMREDERAAYVDGYIESLGAVPTLLYSLPAETTFDGTPGQQIDTGVKLFDEPKSFTIIVDATPDYSMRNATIVDGTAFDPDPYAFFGGVAIKTTPAWEGSGLTITGNKDNGTIYLFGWYATEERTKVAVTFENGMPCKAYFKKASGSDVTIKTLESEYPAITHNITATIGANMIGYEGCAGTIYSVDIYNYAMTDEEIAEKLV